MTPLTPAPAPETRLQIVEAMCIQNALETRSQLLGAIDAADAVALDLSTVSEFDTAGVQLLVMAKRYANQAGKALRIATMSDAVRDTFSLYNLRDDLEDIQLSGATTSKEASGE